jgi:hypothetical protein
MFIQVIQGQVSDRDELRDALETWHRELAPGAVGWLGSTSGVTADGHFITLARFESAEAAQRNSHRTEQHNWWMETAKLFAGDVAFHDCTDVRTFMDGGSDDAGFVQVIQGAVRDPRRMDELTRRAERRLREFRPDILGWTTALHGDGNFTQAVYFTSEAEAREGERKEPPAELGEIWAEEQQLMSDLRYYDLTEPILLSPR